MVNLKSTPNGEYLCDTSPAADFGGKQFIRATGCGIAADKRMANIEAATGSSGVFGVDRPQRAFPFDSGAASMLGSSSRAKHVMRLTGR